MKKHYPISSVWLILLFLLAAPAAMAQLKVGDNPATINKASILELESVRQGLLLPRIPDTTLAPLTSAPDGMIIYFTGTQSLLVRRGGYWSKLADSLSASVNSWQLKGNAGTTAANYLGTSDGQPLSLRTNGTEAINISTTQTVALKQVPASTSLISVLVIDPTTGTINKRDLSAAAFGDAIRTLNNVAKQGFTIRADTLNAAYGVTTTAADSTITMNVPVVNGTSQKTGLLTYADWAAFSNKQKAITIGTFLTTPNANGLVLDPATGILQLTAADATNPGALSTGNQSIAGVKNFVDSAHIGGGLSVTGQVTGSNGLKINAGGANITGNVTLATAPPQVSTATTSVLFRNPVTGAIENRAVDSAAFTSGIRRINGQTGPAIYIATGKAGNDVALDSTTTANKLTLNIPDASVTARGVVNDSAQTFAGYKTVRDTFAVGKNAIVGAATKPNSTLQVSGSMSLNIRTVNSTGSLTETDNTVLVDASGGAVNITLPPATNIAGRIYTIKKVGGTIDNSVTIQPTGGQIEGGSSYVIYNNYTYVTIQTDGSNWYVIRK
ncbi:hypothetical protein [Chitinophaga nivalis]|uniref:Uncharacterized protein n=1 Tax=Chitinophaga nivalis TaxID=2991709 RepID=A0ABT3IEE9_9BACT|nr:hypothetical protein [Chitinophaga nivalis]MCW3467982.1 hypothetical protein [Chitinophaga nivalis]MCW3482327.1 hypothetical protein [Chitinophaga nivalis]